MLDTSALYQSIVSGEHWYEPKVQIESIGNLYSNSLMSLSTKHSLFADGVPQIGCAVAGEINLSFILGENDVVPKMAQIDVSVCARNETQVSEYIPKGTYYIDTREESRNAEGLRVMTIHGYDAMLKFEQMYPSDNGGGLPIPDPIVKDNVVFRNWIFYTESSVTPQMDLSAFLTPDVSGVYYAPSGVSTYAELEYQALQDGVTVVPELDGLNLGNYTIKIEFTDAFDTPYSVVSPTLTVSEDAYPMQDITMLQFMASQVGVTIDPRTTAIMDRGYTFSLPAGYTMREMLGYIASAYCGNFIISDEGKLLLVAFGGEPSETYYLVDEYGNAITFGGDRILIG